MTNINDGVLNGVRRTGARVRDVIVDGGVPGAPLGLRVRGATKSGHPTSGSWRAGDEVRDRLGNVWICVISGTPGSWVSSGLYFNVLSYGADTTGVTDSTTAIQSAITAATNAGSGTVFFPSGTYKISSALTIGVSSISLVGNGPSSTILSQTSTTANGITISSASGLNDISITGIGITGPGSGSGIGITAIANAGALRVERLTLANVIVTSMGSDGAQLTNCIMSRVDQCKFISNGAKGLHLEQGTTWRISNCWFTGNPNDRGFYANQTISSSLLDCGSDSNAIGYELLSCTAIQMIGCDVSGTAAGGSGLDGTSIKVNACFGVFISGSFIANNAAIGLYVTAASGSVIAYGIIETATGSPTASIKTDSGTDLLIGGADLVTATSYAANTISLLAGSYCFFSDIEAGIAQVDSGLTLLGGTASTPPLKMTSGTNLTSAAAGAVEFDGTAFYDTSVASSRQVRRSEQIEILSGTRTFTNNTSAQAIFNATANGALTVAASTTYQFECLLDITGLSSSSHTLNFGLAGTATFTNIMYEALTATASGGASSLFAVTTNSATAIVASTTGTVLLALIKGTMRINAGGTIIPQLTQVTASTAAVVAINSYFKAWPIGSGSVTNVGNWS